MAECPARPGEMTLYTYALSPPSFNLGKLLAPMNPDFFLLVLGSPSAPDKKRRSSKSSNKSDLVVPRLKEPNTDEPTNRQVSTTPLGHLPRRGPPVRTACALEARAGGARGHTTTEEKKAPIGCFVPSFALTCHPQTFQKTGTWIASFLRHSRASQ